MVDVLQLRHGESASPAANPKEATKRCDLSFVRNHGLACYVMLERQLRLYKTLHLNMSTSRGRAEDVYESQNDQRLDELHSKIRTLRGVRSSWTNLQCSQPTADVGMF